MLRQSEEALGFALCVTSLGGDFSVASPHDAGRCRPILAVPPAVPVVRVAAAAVGAQAGEKGRSAPCFSLDFSP